MSGNQWEQERPPPYPWERDALDHVRRLMPSAEPYRAWATFSFTAQSVRINECDVLIAVPARLYLVEIKRYPGRLRISGSTWNAALPPRLAEKTLATQLADLEGATVALQENVRCTRRPD
ncbi:NERD domain-containing protein [Streptomyces sp. CA-294286]|uniref:NERD domain-containing protein n=1 Tax=Streptomyces sp. CA-294286 TaxID=3240070 RepID=UPI003D8DF2D2